MYLVLCVLLSVHLGAQPRLDLVASIHGNGDDQVRAMALDREGNVYLTGTTTSFDLGTPGAFQPHRASSEIFSVDRVSTKLRPIALPTGARIEGLTSDPQNPGTVYVVTDRGLWKTTDGGVTWAALSGGLLNGRAPFVFAVAPSVSCVLYAVFTPMSSDSNGAPVFRSSDGGTTWTAVAPLPSPALAFAVDPRDPFHILVSGSQSIDGGASWTAGPLIDNITFDPINPNTVYGSTFGGAAKALVKSTDSGASFVPLNFPPFGFVFGILCDSNHPGTVYVSGVRNIGAEHVGDDGIFKSADGGLTWSRVSTLLGLSLLEDPITGTFYAWGGRTYGAYRSDDGFLTMTKIVAAYATPSPDILAVTGPGELWITTYFYSPGEIFVSKLDRDGHVIFTTYIGSTSGSTGGAIAVGASGGVYIVGNGFSEDFPITASIQDASNGAGMYLMRLSSDGTRLEYSTRITGVGAVTNGITVDAAGSVYLTGTTPAGYPTTPNSFQPAFQPPYPYIPPGAPVHEDAFATKIAADGKTLVYSTYFGNGGVDRAWAVAVDSNGNAYVAGTKLWKLNSTGTALLWNTTLGDGEFRSTALDKAGNLYVCGGTFFSPYTSANAFQRVAPSYYGGPIDRRFQAGDADAFVAKFSPAGDVLYSTLFGGRYREAATAITVDEEGNAAVVGYTSSMDLPMRYPFQAPFNKSTGFLAKVNVDGSDLLYSTYLGDSRPFGAVTLARDPSGALVLAGSTTGGDSEAFVNRIIEAQTPPPIHVDAVLNTASLFGGPVTPGEWITVRGGGFGPDSRVMLGNAPMLLASVAATEILARVPDTFQPNGATTMRIDSSGLSSQSIFVSSASSAAGIFTQDATGIGQALAFNADGSLNNPANPAARGTEISIAANGLGVLSPDQTIGLFFPCGGTIRANVQSGPIAGLPGDRNSLVSAMIPAKTCSSSGTAEIALVVDGIITFAPPVTISIQ